jgi:hypothetical protein
MTNSARFDSPPSRSTASFAIETGTWRECMGRYAGNPESGCKG